MVSAGFIPVLVFDCVALRLREGISGLFFQSGWICVFHTRWAISGNCWVLLVSFLPLKKSTLGSFWLFSFDKVN